jgi:hypothetical protein
VLQDVGTTLEHNLMRQPTERPRFERRALSLSVDPRNRADFEAFLVAEGQAFLVRVDDWLAAHQVDAASAEPPPGIRLGVGVYQILDEPKRTARRPANSR